MQCAYALYFFTRIFRLPVEADMGQGERQSVSIIICARNEAENLRKYLPAVLSQQYLNFAGKANYEVIVVNDGSTDGTAEVLKEMEMRYDHLWDVVIPPGAPRDMPGKKFALSKGLEIAANQWLLLTDADCTPVSEHWLQQMVTPLAGGKQIVAGYGGYNTAPGILNAFIRWETLHTFLQYSTYAMAGMPYMAVGRNMACTRGTLEKAQQHQLWKKLPSGDDDLLMCIAATRHNTAIVAAQSSFTRSGASKTFRQWIAQKQRHLSTGKYYKPGIQLLLGGYALCHALMWLSFIALLCSHLLQSALAIMAVRCVCYWGMWSYTAMRLQEGRLIYLFPVFDIGWMVYNFAFFPFITWKNKQHWK